MARVSQAQINLIINDEKADATLKNLAVRYKELSEARDAAAKAHDFDSMKSLDKTLNAIGKEAKEMTREVINVEQVLQKLNQVPTKDLRAAVTKLSLDMSKLDRNTEAYKEKAGQLAKIQNELALSAGRAADRVQGFWGRLKNTIFTFDLSSIANGVKNYAKKAVDAYAEYDDTLADVMKTTGLAKDSVEELSASLSKIDTRTSQNELLGLASQAGKLGISAKEDVEQFTIAADKIGVALGEDLGDKEEAINTLGKLVDLFKLKDQYGFGDAMLKIGSAVNSLGAASTANEGYIVEFLSRTGGIGVTADMAATSLMGLGAAFDALGQPAEASATVINKLIAGMFSKTSEYAKVAKMDLKSFTELLKTDANEAMLKVLEGMKGQDLGYTAQMLGEVGETGARAAQAVATIAGQIDMVREQQTLASMEFEKGTSILNEFNTKNSTAQARREKQQKAMTASLVELGRELQPILDLFYAGTITASQALRMLISVISEYKGAIVAIIVIVGLYTTWQKVSANWSKLQAYWSGINKAAVLAETQTMTGATVATKLLAAAKMLLTGNFRAAAVAAKSFWVSLGPVGWAVTAITALVGVMSIFKDRTKEVSGAYAEFGLAVRQENATYDDLKKQLTETKEGTTQRAELIKLINERYKEYLPGLLTEKNTTEEIATALDNATAAMKRNIAEKIRATETEKAEQALYDAKKAAVSQLLEEYNHAGTRTETQMALAAQKFSELIDQFETYPNSFEGTATRISDIFAVMGYQAVNNTDVWSAKMNKWGGSINFVRGAMEDLGASFKEYSRTVNLTNALLPTVPTTGTPTGTTGIDGDGVCKKCGKKPCVCKTGGGDAGKKSWSLENDEKFMAARVALKRKQLNGELATEEQFSKELLALEVTTLEARIKSNKEKGKDLEKLNEQLLDKQLQQAKEAKSREEKLAKEIQGGETDLQKAKREYDEKLRSLGLYGKQAEQMTATEKAALLQIEKGYAQKVSAINLDTLNKNLDEGKKSMERKLTALRLAQADELADAQTLEQKKQLLARWFSAEQLQAVRTDQEANRLLKSKFSEEQENLSKQELQSLLVTFQAAASELNAQGGLLDGVVKMTEEDQAKLRDIIDKLREELSKLGQSPVASTNTTNKVDVFGMSVGDWSTLFQNTEGGLTALQKMEVAAKAIGNAFNEVSNLMSAVEARDLKKFEKNQDKKKKSLDKQLKSGQISQESYNAKIQKLDEETDAKREETERKQAERQKALAIFNVLVSTAVAIVKALEAGPIVGPILAGVIGALAAVQVAAIIAQPVPGAEEGGLLVERSQDGRLFNAKYDPKRRGPVSSPTVIVGEGGTEYVVPSDGYANPTVRPVLDIIERARRSGSLGSINLPALLASNMGGRATGGAVPATTTGALPTDTSIPWSPDLLRRVIALLELNEEAMAKLLSRLEGPITAEVAMLGRNGIVENTEKYTAAKQRTTIQ